MPKNYSAVLSFLLLCGLTYYSFYTYKPHTITGAETPETKFSTTRALQHLKIIAKKPHAVGNPAHKEVQDYLVSVLDSMGLETQLQEGFAYRPGWGALSKAQNIMARIRGTGDGKALLVFSHYDSAPHTASYGASDAGSGVVTVLEAIRAYLAQGQKPKNDIIILFTDAEELGLNGAALFVREHPWAKDVKVALNFEARGSGGPSNMIVETNGGNAGLIKAFAKANPSHPYANSLAYSIYKILPNDTDSTVMREVGDIDGFFFAFLSDHFDYHTAMDTYDRLDRSSLQHQGSYLMPLLTYFANADLNVKSDIDYVYLNLPIVKMMYYPFGLIWPMLVLALICFIALLIYGIKKQHFTLKTIGRGFLPLLIAMLASAGFTYVGWKILLAIYPKYTDILQGFTYNGYAYITAFTAFALAICFFTYKLFYRPYQSAALSMAPLFIWLLISMGLAIGLPGASFFTVPLFFVMLAIFLIIKFRKVNLFWLCLCCMPAIFIVANFIIQFPLGLGLVMLPGSALFTVLLFGLLLPVTGFYQINGRLALVFLTIGIAGLIYAHAQSDFTKNRPFPTSLDYVYDMDTQKAYYATYNSHPDDWIKNIMGKNIEDAKNLIQAGGAGKYGIDFTYAAPAQHKAVAPSSIYVRRDEVNNGQRNLEFIIYPQRDVNDLILLCPPGTPFTALSFNGQEVNKHPDENYIFESHKTNRFLSYRVSDRYPLTVTLSLPADFPLRFTLYDLSYDLLSRPDFNIPARPKNSIPMPFINTDAIITKQTLDFTKPLKNSIP